jgi:hypothetical protein
VTCGRCAPRAPAIVGAVCAALMGTLCAVPLARAGWSAPAIPPGCAAALATPGPLVVFPSAGPLVRSGPGALLWAAPGGCGARGAGVEGAAETLAATLGADDLPGPGRALVPAVGGLATVTAATGTAAGDVLTVGAPGAAAVSGYLGDAVLASPVRSPRGGWELAVRAQRHYNSALGRPRLVPAGAGPVTAVAAALDYRAEILLVWAARGEIYARELPAAGAAGPARRLGSAGADPEIGALLSDDGHAIVAWRSQSAPGGGSGSSATPTVGSGSAPPGPVGEEGTGMVGGGGASRVGGEAASTAIELSLFQTGPGATLEPGSLRQVERFRNLPDFPPPSGSLHLTRLSSEAVMLAWTGLDADGRYVVRASPVSLRRGAWAPVTISGATAAHGDDAVLTDLVPGPDAEALVLWSAGPRLPSGAPNPRRQAILAARGHYAGRGEVAFEVPEPIAPPGPNGPPTAAFDPQTGSALAAWVTLAGGAGPGRLAYALRAAGSASSPPPAGARAATGVSPSEVALPLLALLLLTTATVLARVVGRRRGHTQAVRRG